ncbi:MAG: ethanolamine ammonia-lyase subunit EutC [Methylophilaceae bacterium]|jgi:ethanolamine ammonia-lyase small subunit|nr:ethanolamine ammonia-lyase subunit EutC [Methylophilaceae bacterium]
MSDSDENTPLSSDPWRQLKAFTNARIALGRVGSSLPTKEVLDFGMAHAMARDAVHTPLDAEAFCSELHASGFETVQVKSAAPDRASYLLRPDLGRRLSEESESLLRASACKETEILFVVGDGLSSLAITNHARPLLEALRALMPAGQCRAPVVVATQARVALSDPIGELLNARIVVMLIGERPGLSSPDSLGIYITYGPRIGRQDSERNCISNVRPEGLNYQAAARKTRWLVVEALRLRLSGIGLKDQSDVVEIGAVSSPGLPDKSDPVGLP